MTAAKPVSALPADPMRPFTAKTCEEARERLEEARLGSPLISKQENAEVLRLAEEQVERLCGPKSD